MITERLESLKALLGGRPPAAVRPPSFTPATTADDRRAVLSELAQERAAAAAHAGDLASTLREAQARLRSSESLVQLRRREAAAAQAASLTGSVAHDRRVAHLEARLRDGAPAILDDFRRWLLRLDEEARRKTETVSHGLGEADGLGQRREEWATNRDDVLRVLGPIRAALAELPELGLEPDEEKITARLLALRDTIPLGHDGTPDIAPPPRKSLGLPPGEARELRWRIEEEQEERRRWGAGERR